MSIYEYMRMFTDFCIKFLSNPIRGLEHNDCNLLMCSTYKNTKQIACIYTVQT